MRTNIDIDDELMAAAMEAGGFKTKKEAVEEGLRLLRRRKVYEGLLALRGQLHWDDSDEAWAGQPSAHGGVMAVQEPRATYGGGAKASASKTKRVKPAARKRSKAL